MSKIDQKESKVKLGFNLRNHIKLIDAAADNRTDIIQDVLESGDIDIDHRFPSSEGSTALHFAAASNSLEAADILIKNHANLNERNFLEHTPLYLAARHGHIQMAQKLIDSGANVGMALFAAAASNNEVAMELLLEVATKKNVNYHNSENLTPLIMVARTGSAQMISRLLEKGAEIFAFDRNGDSTLMNSVIYNNYESADELIKRGAAKHFDGIRALIKSARIGHDEISELLVRSGVEVEYAISIAEGYEHDVETSDKLKLYLADHKQPETKETAHPSRSLSPLTADVLSSATTYKAK